MLPGHELAGQLLRDGVSRVAERFPLLTDIHVHGALVEALRRAGWDVLRAVDLLPSNTVGVQRLTPGDAAPRGQVKLIGRALAVHWPEIDEDLRPATVRTALLIVGCASFAAGS